MFVKEKGRLQCTRRTNFTGDVILLFAGFVDYLGTARIITLEEVESVCTYRLISLPCSRYGMAY